MSKFKAGDRVVVVRSNHPLQVSYLGERGEVKSVSQEGEYEVTVILDGMGCGTCFDSSELEFEHVYDELSKKPCADNPMCQCGCDEDSSVGPEVDTRLDDAVEHPQHYIKNGFEVIEIIEAFELNFRLANVIKYVLRADSKHDDNGVQDISKALWYLKRELASREGSQ